VAWRAAPIIEVTSTNKQKLSVWMEKLKLVGIDVNFVGENKEVLKITTKNPVVIGYILRPLEETKEFRKVGGKTINLYSYKEQERAKFGPVDFEFELNNKMNNKRREERNAVAYEEVHENLSLEPPEDGSGTAAKRRNLAHAAVSSRNR
jgi:hypothetical protein